jgi:hypothetical protein
MSRTSGRIRYAARAATASAVLMALSALAAQAQSPVAASTPVASPAAVLASAPAGWTRATTVFVNTVIGSRTGGSAKRINESHAEMEAKGWRFMNLETYTENGDLVGFFVTYVR